MRLTEPQVAVAEAFHDQFGLPEYIKNDPDRTNKLAREWTERLCEQMKFSFPNAGFCHKGGGGGRPPATDVLALKNGSIFVGWDVILGQGTAGQSFDASGDSVDLTGQEPITVDAINHLRLVTDPGEPNPDPKPNPTPTVDLSSLHFKLDAMIAQNHTVLAELQALRDNQLSVAAWQNSKGNDIWQRLVDINTYLRTDLLTQFKTIATSIRPKLF